MNGFAILQSLVAAVTLTAPGRPQQAGRITGAVVDVLGQPLASAQVAVVTDGVDGPRATCDEKGAFALDEIPWGYCLVRASAPGHYWDWKREWLDGKRPAANVRLQLMDAADVHGQVVGADGTPVSRAVLVFLAREKHVGGGPGEHAWTDAAGRYRLTVPLGEVLMTVIASRHACQSARLVVAGPTRQDFKLLPDESASYRITIEGASPEQWTGLKVQLRPGLSDLWADARDSNHLQWELGRVWPHASNGSTIVYEDLPLSLRVGIVVTAPHAETIGLRVPAGGGVHNLTASIVPSRHEQNTSVVVRGIVRDPSGNPLSGRRIAQGTDVAVTDAAGAFELATRASASGFFSLELDEEDFVIHSRNIRDTGSYCHREPGPEVIELVADRAARITGSLVDSAGTAMSDAELQLQVDEYETRTDMAHTGPTTSVGRTRTAHDGSFALGRIDAHVAGKVWLRVTSPSGPLLAGPWALSPGQHLPLGTLALPAAASIEGTIVDDEGKPRSGIAVCLFRHGEMGLDLWQVYTDRLGRYACRGLPAGDYSVNIDKPRSKGIEWPDYARVTVRAGQHVVVTRSSWLWRLLQVAACALLILVLWRAWRWRRRTIA